MTLNDSLELLDRLLKQEKLNNVQELIFCKSWEGNTYKKIASTSGYTEEHIRDNGAQLWQLLSTVFAEKVTKRNFKAVFERYARQQQTKTLKSNIDWQEAVDVTSFSGRNDELACLERWLTDDCCRLLGVFGIGGIGKTSLAITLAQKVAANFDFLVWRSLRNAPPINDLLDNIIQFLSQQQEFKQNLPKDTGSKISKLIDNLQSSRCLLVLDNGETILKSGVSCGRYRTGYEGYGELLRCVGEINHQSCLILTSREKPQEFTALEGDSFPVRSFPISGLTIASCRSIFRSKGNFYGSPENWQTLTHNYSGNPLALKIVASTIQDLFQGNLQEFLQQDILTFDDIEDLLREQFNRLSRLEQEVMYWLAIEREPITLVQLQKNFLQSISTKKLFEVIKSLSRRSLIEQTTAGFTQQPVVMEYLIERQIQKVASEIETETPRLLSTHALIKAETKDYVRESQKRLTLRTLATTLTDKQNSGAISNSERKSQIVSKLRQITKQFQGKSEEEVGYAIGNIINLLQQLGIDLNDFDFSQTFIRQAYLSNSELHQVKFQNSHIADSVFSESLDFIYKLTFNSQGDILASCHASGDIYLWSVATREKLRCWSAYQNKWLESLAFSPDDQILASSNSFESIKLWDVETGKLLKTLSQKVAPFSNLLFFGQKILVFANLSNQVCLWNISTEKYLATLAVETSQILCIAISSDEQKLACGCVDGMIKVWDLSTYQVINTLQIPTSIPSIAFAPDGQSLLVSCLVTNKVGQWDYRANTCIKEFSGHTGLVFDIDVSSKTGLLVTGGYDYIIRLWQIDTGECLNIFAEHQNVVSSVVISPNGQLLASGGFDSSIKFWSITDGHLLKSLQGYQATNWSLAFSPDDRQIASGFDDYSLRLWDISTGTCLKNFQKHDAEIRAVVWHPQSQIIVSGDCLGTIKIWDLETEQCLRTLSQHSSWVNSLAFSTDGQFLASGSTDQQIIIWNPQNGQVIQKMKEPDGNLNVVWAIAFHPYNSSILASGGYSCVVNLWNIHDGKLLKSFMGHRGFLDSIVFSPDGSTIASSSYDCTVKLWDVATGRCLRTFESHTCRILNIAFSPDGKMIASGSFDCTVKLWDVNTGECLQTIPESNFIISLCFNKEGTILAYSIRNGEIKFWKLAAEKYQKTLQLPRLYERMNITGVSGLSDAQKTTLKVLGAVEI